MVAETTTAAEKGRSRNNIDQEQEHIVVVVIGVFH